MKDNTLTPMIVKLQALSVYNLGMGVGIKSPLACPAIEQPLYDNIQRQLRRKLSNLLHEYDLYLSAARRDSLLSPP